MNKGKFVDVVFNKLLEDKDKELLESMVKEKEKIEESGEQATNEKILEAIMKKLTK